MKRYLHNILKKDLKEKMVFLTGPRQVGKTTLALQILGNDKTEQHPAYINWDFPENRKNLIKGILPARQKMVILDEIHKYKNWRNLVKGFYDKHKSHVQFLVTGSASLDYYRRGGDSLLGRYYCYRLHPLSLYEISSSPTQKDVKKLFQFGGFPEVYLKSSPKFLNKWCMMRVSKILQDDLASLEQIKEMSQIELLTTLIKDKVGSLLSLNNLREDLSCSHEAVSSWIQILENIYYCYRIYPYTSSHVKSLKKQSKVYLWDWSELDNRGARFENMLASHLLKYCHYHEDVNGEKMDLRFLRDKEKREIDFIVLKKNKPLFAVECKTGDKGLSQNIFYFSKRTDIPIFYQVHLGKTWDEKSENKLERIPLTSFCTEVLKV